MFVRELQKGITVLLRENVQIEVAGTVRGEVGPEQKPVVYVFDTAGRQWTLHPGDIVEPIHRPWEDGKTEVDMLREVVAAANSICDYRDGVHGVNHSKVMYDGLQQALKRLRRTEEDYVLGKPLHKDPARNESLDDRHMTP